ncbi:biosurfactant protein 1 [Haloarcula sp. H-GB5]
MTRQETDHEALRPLGEATHVPDDQLASSGGEPRRQRSGGVNAGYPDDSTPSESSCESCGVSIHAGQSKCRFCLTNHLDAAGDQDPSDAGWSFLHVVQMFVEASTFYGAVAKGSAAASLLADSDSDPAVDDCQLIYDLAEEPATQLADQWPSLPSATRITSPSGEAILETARERTTWRESRHVDQHATFLYDETGSGIQAEDRLARLREDADDDLWLVPAIALQESVAETSSEHSRHERPNSESLECRECGRETTHRFREFEIVPHDDWTSQPMWACQRCGTPRYGPNPDAGQ